MAQRKKLQVFISSTYTDLKEERQAAVGAILTAGHIPAGMELFTAGDESQMNVIKKWIDESDVFLLILGGRYGSIEPKSKKSYIHLEFEYAIEKNKPLFSVVIDEYYLNEKAKKSENVSDVMELDNRQKLKDFRNFVLARMVKFWSDSRDIQLAIHGTMREFSDRSDVIGWIPGNEAVNTGVVAEQIALLTKENATLREQLENFSRESMLYDGLTFDELYTRLNEDRFDISKFDQHIKEMLRNVATVFDKEEPSLLHLLWILKDRIFDSYFPPGMINKYRIALLKLCNYGLLDSSKLSNGMAEFTDQGRKFFYQLTKHDKASKAKDFKI